MDELETNEHIIFLGDSSFTVLQPPQNSYVNENNSFDQHSNNMENNSLHQLLIDWGLYNETYELLQGEQTFSLIY